MILFGCNGNTPASQLSTVQPNNLLSSGDQQSSYLGSQAYDNAVYDGETVNSHTGDLNLAKSLINLAGVLPEDTLNLKLIYSSSQASSGFTVFQLPTGWSYNISYLTDTSATIDGYSYVIDYNWADQGGHHSGLKYVNNHAIKFSNQSTESAISDTDKRMYHYLYSAADGSHEYFDSKGKELAKIDRVGNSIRYYYTNDGHPNQASLDYIQDSYGQIFTFKNNGRGTISIIPGTNPDTKPISNFTYNATGISSIADALYHTDYNYNVVNKIKLITSIQSPSGLTTQVKYTTLNANSCITGSLIKLSAVTELSHADGTNPLNKTLYTYGSTTNGNNFTGYPNKSYCIGGDNDNLFDSDNFKYKYDVLITKVGLNNSPDQKSNMVYDFLHLTLEQDNLDKVVVKPGDNHFQTTYTYDIAPVASERSASFDQPIQITKHNQGQGESILQTDLTYDVYNQPLSSISNIISNGKLIKFSSSIISYFPESLSAWYITRTRLDTDEVNHTTINIQNILDQTHKAIATTTKDYNKSPWDVNSFTYDNSGRLLTSNMSWASNGSHEGIGSTNLSYSYAYANNRLTITTTDALNHASTKIINTLLPGSPVLSETTSMKKTTTHVYDTLGREIKITSPLGENITTAYYVMQLDQRNQTVKTNPQSYTITTDYDLLGQTIDIKDNGGAKSSERILGTNTYDSLGNVVSKTDRFKNVTSMTYDEFGRLVSTIDPLKNNSSTSYDDINLTQNTSINRILRTSVTTDGANNKLNETVYSSSGDSRYVITSYDGFNNKLNSQSYSADKL
ncbi:MAG: RHS repeat protein, partial [Burkholderiales bacterium]|nr:RHS repeat protein [Burkholderiales bacterium]